MEKDFCDSEKDVEEHNLSSCCSAQVVNGFCRDCKEGV